MVWSKTIGSRRELKKCWEVDRTPSCSKHCQMTWPTRRRKQVSSVCNSTSAVLEVGNWFWQRILLCIHSNLSGGPIKNLKSYWCSWFWTQQTQEVQTTGQSISRSNKQFINSKYTAINKYPLVKSLSILFKGSWNNSTINDSRWPHAKSNKTCYIIVALQK